MAGKAALVIYGQFRKSSSDDPDVFYAAAKSLFTRYPEPVVVALGDPRHGIAGEQTFLPSIAELRASLDRRMAPILAENEKRRRYAETEELLRQRASPTPEQRLSATARWDAVRSEITGKAMKEELRKEAELHLVELYHQRNDPLPPLSWRVAPAAAEPAEPEDAWADAW